MTNERKQFLADVFVTAMEGGVNYWAAVKKYHWTNAKNGADNQSYLDMADLDGFYAVIVDEEEEKEYRVTSATIQHGLSVIREGACKYLHPETRKAIIAADAVMDAGDIDASLADDIVQAGLFDDVIYG